MTDICVSKLIIIGSDNGLSPDRRQATIWTNARILSIGPLGTKLSDILISTHIFSFKKMHLKMSSGKWRPCCLSLNVLRAQPLCLLLVHRYECYYMLFLGFWLTLGQFIWVSNKCSLDLYFIMSRSKLDDLRWKTWISTPTCLWLHNIFLGFISTNLMPCMTILLRRRERQIYSVNHDHPVVGVLTTFLVKIAISSRVIF